MNGYKIFYNGKQAEVEAESLYAAKLEAVRLFKVPKSKTHMVSVVLCEVNGETVTHSTAEIG